MSKSERRGLLREAPGKTVGAKLTSVSGVSWRRSKGMCQRCGILQSTPWASRTLAQIDYLAAYLVRIPSMGLAVASRERASLRKLCRAGSVKASRLRQGLPIRGQNTGGTSAGTAKRLNRSRVSFIRGS